MNNDNRQNREYNLNNYQDLVDKITYLNGTRAEAIWQAIEQHHPVWYPQVIDDIEDIDQQHTMAKAEIYEQIRNHVDSQAAHEPAPHQQQEFDFQPREPDLTTFEAIHRLNCNHIFKVVQASTRLQETGNLYFLNRIEQLDVANERIQALLYNQARLNIGQKRATQLHSEWDERTDTRTTLRHR